MYYSSVFVALGTQHATDMSHINICGLSGSKYFSASSHKRMIFEKNVSEHKMCVFIFLYNFCPKHFSFYEELSEI